MYLTQVILFFIYLVEAQSQAAEGNEVASSSIQPSKLPCKSCLGLPGYMWCGRYQSPYANSWCDNIISESVCETSIASVMDHCNDKQYDPDTTYVPPDPTVVVVPDEPDVVDPVPEDPE